MPRPSTSFVLLTLLALGCPARREGDDNLDGGEVPTPDNERPGNLVISPNPIEVSVSSAEQTVPLTVTSTTLGDVTQRATMTLSEAGLGSVVDGRLVIRAGLLRGGRAKILAGFGIQKGTADLRIKLLAPDYEDPSAPQNPSTYFSGGQGGAKPEWAYPLPGAMLPRNHPEMNFQFKSPPDSAAYRLSIRSPTYEQDIYLGPPGRCAARECKFQLVDERWLNIARSIAGGDASLTLSASPGPGMSIGSAAPLSLSVSPEDVKGGLYYWSTTITGIYRVPLGAKQAQVFIKEGNEFGCSGCHAVSRDGKKVALAFGEANGIGGGIVDGADGTKYVLKPPAAGQWNMQTFSPKGDMLLVNWQQGGAVINADTGQKLFTFPGKLAQPEWSPDGETIAYVGYPPGGSGEEWTASNTGDIRIIPWNNGTWGEPQIVVPHKPGQEYHFYPTWTPDSKWIVFNTGKVPCRVGSGCTTYDPTNTVLRIVRAIPGATPIELKNATYKTGFSTNWPRVAPFAQNNGKLIFFTFSAKFPYGFVNLSKNPQIWMAAIDLAKAESKPEQDPSYAPFWLTFQKTDENNHLGTWTQDVACTTDEQCPEEFQCVGGQCVPRVLG